MGREIKRVPLDFDWPLNKVWSGFVNPYYRKCPDPHCHNGRTPARALAEAAVNLILIAGSSAMRDGSHPHPWIRQIGCDSFDFIDAGAAELSVGLAGRDDRPFLLHDCVDRYVAVKKVIYAAGLDGKKWGYCPVCKGHCIDPAVKQQYDDWTATEPPSGEGWQIWETVSEGSPISPVFPSADALVDWLVGQGYSREGADSFVKSGWVPSMVSVGGKIFKDIESAILQNKDETTP